MDATEAEKPWHIHLNSNFLEKDDRSNTIRRFGVFMPGTFQRVCVYPFEKCSVRDEFPEKEVKSIYLKFKKKKEDNCPSQNDRGFSVLLDNGKKYMCMKNVQYNEFHELVFTLMIGQKKHVTALLIGPQYIIYCQFKDEPVSVNGHTYDVETVGTCMQECIVLSKVCGQQVQ